MAAVLGKGTRAIEHEAAAPIRLEVSDSGDDAFQLLRRRKYDADDRYGPAPRLLQRTSVRSWQSPRVLALGPLEVDARTRNIPIRECTKRWLRHKHRQVWQIRVVSI